MSGKPGVKILIIKLSAIGDVVMATPVIRCFRQAWPDARIDWLVEDMSAGLIRGHPALDEVIVWPKAAWKKRLRQRDIRSLLRDVRRFAGDLRRRRYDRVFDLQGFLKSGILARVTGAPHRIGLDSKEGSRFLMTRVIPWDRTDTRMGAQYRQFVSGVGLDPGAFEMDLAVDSAHEAAESFCRESGLSRPYAAFCPFASNRQKQWAADRWSRLAEGLRREMGLQVALLGGPSDRAAAEAIAAGTRVPVTNAVGRLTLRLSAVLIRNSALVVGGDTGLTHMGIGFHVPTVALFGPTHPYNETERAHTALISRHLSCAPCRRDPTCDGRYDCMTAISVDEVLREARRVRGGGTVS